MEIFCNHTELAIYYYTPEISELYLMIVKEQPKETKTTMQVYGVLNLSEHDVKIIAKDDDKSKLVKKAKFNKHGKYNFKCDEYSEVVKLTFEPNTQNTILISAYEIEQIDDFFDYTSEEERELVVDESLKEYVWNIFSHAVIK